MDNKFVNIDNLRLVWDEINKRFIRTSDLSNQLSLLSESVFKSTDDIQLTPDSSWIIDEGFYNEFLDFINNDSVNKYILDSDNRLWNIISKMFYDENARKFNGLLISSNTNDGDVYFWYIRVIQKPLGGYELIWQKYIGDLLYGDFVTASKYSKDITKLNTIISNLIDRINVLEEKNDIEISPDNPTIPDLPNDEEWFTIKCYLRDQNNGMITGASVINMISISKIGDQEYESYDGDVEDIARYNWNAKEVCFEIDILKNYAVAVTFKKDKYKNKTHNIGFNFNQSINLIMTPNYEESVDGYYYY